VSEAYEYATNICKLKESGQGLVTNADQSEALVYCQLSELDLNVEDTMEDWNERDALSNA
jgi:hypothetical protein